MQNQMGVNSLIFTITQRTTRVVDADRCTLYLLGQILIKKHVRILDLLNSSKIAPCADSW